MVKTTGMELVLWNRFALYGVNNEGTVTIENKRRMLRETHRNHSNNNSYYSKLSGFYRIGYPMRNYNYIKIKTTSISTHLYRDIYNAHEQRDRVNN